jgi:hypothetical protein
VAQHISRKELKKDEVRDTLAHGAEAVLSHRRFVAWLLGIALVAGVAVLGWKFYSEKQTAKAAAVFDDAMKVFQARIRTPGEAVDASEVSYVDQKNKYEDASKKFTDVANRFPHTRPGQLSRYYAALSLEHLGRNEEAARSLQQLANSGTEEFAALARFELAQVDERTGKGDEAVKIYQQLIAKPSVLAPKPVVMLALANHYRQTDASQAARLYSQIKTEYPDSAIAQEADQQLQLLPGKT